MYINIFFGKAINKHQCEKGLIYLKNKKPVKFEKGGIYIAICCFALVVAAISYFGNKPEENPDNGQTQSIANNEIPLPQADDFYNNFDSTDVSDIVTIEESETVIITPTPLPSKPTANESEIAVSKNVIVEDTKFIMPVEGNVIYGFSGDKLVYNEILEDWRTHNGIDIACDKDAAIYASAEGYVSDIYSNSMGKNVRIEHQNGYITIYSNLSDTIEITVGDKIEAGALIGKIGNSSLGDFTNEPHLHFEIIQNGKFIDPTVILANE